MSSRAESTTKKRKRYSSVVSKDPFTPVKYDSMTISHKNKIFVK